MDALKGIEKIIRKSAFDEKKKKSWLKFNPGLALTGVRTTGPRRVPSNDQAQIFVIRECNPNESRSQVLSGTGRREP